jgi:ubiquinol-cytochrome c reductase cytochrome b subunit
MLTRRMVLWLDDRLALASLAKRNLRKAFPDHWSFLLGEIALYCFVILVLTGVFLTFFFEASSREVVYQGPYQPLQGAEISAAYDSVLRMSLEVRAGLVMRQIHHWAAVVFVAAIAMHLLRVFFTGAFRRPREINWVVGVSLLGLAMAAGFTGYSLPDDLLSGTGVRIVYSGVLSVPFVGPWAAFLIFGGEPPTADMIGRLYVLHIMIVPALIAVALSIHLSVVWIQKHTTYPTPGRSPDEIVGSPLWPRYALKATGVAFMVFAVLALLGGLFQINPVWIYGPFDPTTVPSPAQPDWYLGWVEGALRLAPPIEFDVLGVHIPSVLFPMIVFPALFLGVVLLWPFIERRITGDDAHHEWLDRPRDVPWRTGVGVAGITFAAILTAAGANDVIATRIGVPVEVVTRVLQVALLVLPVALGLFAARVARRLRDREAERLREHSANADGPREADGSEIG